MWDDVTRIPGVILERRRAEEIYQQAKMQAIDPGLLQQGERDLDEASRSAVFSARIVPIHAFGTKRLEMEYQQDIPVERFESMLAVPLRPDAYRAQTAAHLWIKLELDSAHALRDFQIVSKQYPMQMRDRTAHHVKADFEGRNVALSEDFAVKYALEAARGRSSGNPDPSRPGAPSAGCGRHSARRSRHASACHARTRLLRSIVDDRDRSETKCRCGSRENRDRSVRQFPLHAMGEARSQFSSPGNACCIR